MTKEEKARAYDEALKKARFYHGNCPSEPERKKLEGMFPVLRESEDERIRKELKAIVAFIPEANFRAISRKECLAYLEKQKENNEYVFRPLAGTDIAIAAEQAIKRAKEGDHLVLAFNGVYLPVRKYSSAKELVDEYEAYLEKQKEASKAIETVERIDNYIDEHLANAHDMKDSNPDKKYYRGWDDALAEMSRILQDVYSKKEDKFAPQVLPCSAAWFEDDDEKQKEQKPVECIEFDKEFENQISHLIVSVLNGEHKYNKDFVKYVAQSLLGYAKNELKPDEWSKREKLFMKALQTSNAQIGQLIEENYKLKEQKDLDKMIVVSPEVWDKAIADAYENGKKDCEKQKEPHYTKRNALFDKCVKNCDPEVMKKVSDEVDSMLEKEQKEQKPVEYLDKDKVYAIMTKLTNLSYSTRIPINSDEYKQIDEITHDVRSLLDYPIEQKPAEWSLSQLKMFDDILVAIELDKAFTDERVEELVNLLNTCRLRKYSTKPAEWSDEDEKMKESIIKVLYGGGHFAYEAEIDWLKSLPLNLKKKNEDIENLCSNEWSKEDEKIYQTVFKHFNSCKKYSCSTGVKKEHVLSWLKSLKPSWKPSKEQMDVLFNAGNGNYLNGTHMQILRNLYNDLKKLM